MRAEGNHDALQVRPFGRVGVDVTVLSLGGAGLGGLYGSVSDDEAIKAIREAPKLGKRCRIGG